MYAIFYPKFYGVLMRHIAWIPAVISYCT